jgi:hypothetical protein
MKASQAVMIACFSAGPGGDGFGLAGAQIR